MLLIEFRFLSGRYHATPWNHHVNEGVVEWPPSPWRFLRALVATWHLKATTEVREDQVRRIVELLAGECPVYVLPSASAAHLRHYMPLYGGKTTKVFDTFLDVRTGAVIMAFSDVDLDPALIGVLDVLLERMGYFGRAESWVEARRVDAARGDFNAAPVGEPAVEGRDSDTVSVLVPWSADEYAVWREGALQSRLQTATEDLRAKAARKGKEAAATKLSKAQIAREEGNLPGDIFHALLVETGEMRKAGWDRPPGSRWVDYRRPSVDTAPRQVLRRKRPGALPTVARFSVASAVLPRITRAISVGNRVRVSLMSWSDGAAVFAGHETGTEEPMLGHRHVHVLPECHRDDDRISHLTLWAPLGFDAVARSALDRLAGVWGDHDELRLVLLGVGTPDDFPWDPCTDPGRDPGCPYFAVSSEWRSLTPFVPTRHPKVAKSGAPKLDGDGAWIGSPEHDVVRLLAEQGLPKPTIARMERGVVGRRAVPWLDFQTVRPKGTGRRANRGVGGWVLRFESPVRGPLATGYGAHYGLGLFHPGAEVG